MNLANRVGDERRPAGLVARAEARARVPVEAPRTETRPAIFVEASKADGLVAVAETGEAVFVQR